MSYNGQLIKTTLSFDKQKIIFYNFENDTSLLQISGKSSLSNTSYMNKLLLNIIKNSILNPKNKALKINNTTEYKTINNIKIPITDWEVYQDINIKDIKTNQFILKKGEDLIAVMSTTNDYITDLKEYSDYYNEKTVRNMKPAGLILKSKKITKGEFKKIKSVTEFFTAFHKPTKTETEMSAITIKINEFYYNITYNLNPQSEQIVNNIKIIN